MQLKVSGSATARDRRRRKVARRCRRACGRADAEETGRDWSASRSRRRAVVRTIGGVSPIVGSGGRAHRAFSQAKEPRRGRQTPAQSASFVGSQRLSVVGAESSGKQQFFICGSAFPAGHCCGWRRLSVALNGCSASCFSASSLVAIPRSRPFIRSSRTVT